MKLLTRYLARELYFSMALVFAALLMLFALLDLIGQLNEMGQGNYRLGYVLLYVALLLPGHVYELFPVAVLIGAIFGLVQLAANSELTVYRASGVSLQQMIVALLTIGIPLVLLCLLFGEVLAPPSQHLAQRMKLKAQNAELSLREFRSGVWVKDGVSFINVRNVTPEAELLGISIYQFDEDYVLRAITVADNAHFVREREWLLQGVKRTLFTPQGGAQAEVRDRMAWRSSLNPNLFSVLLVAPEQMSALDLYRYTEHLAGNRQKTGRYEIALWNKLAYPLAVWVMLLLALPFSSYHRREGGIGGKVFLGIVLGLGFHFVGRLFANLGALNEWPAVVSATAMDWVFLGVALWMLRRTERR
ncbi:MAG: LPS export ABC transporter permease LptG [Sideroxydans sp.]